MLFFLQLFGLKAGILAGGLTLVIMILPTIVRTTQESLKTVPQSYREGALALGAGKWHMVRTVVLNNFITSLQASSATLTVALYVYANERGETGVAFAIAAVLMLLVFLINFAATLAGKKLKRKAG